MSDEFSAVVQQLTPEIYQNMRRAVELGRWPDGRQVSVQQRETCMQAMIAWEARHLPEEQRAGYMPTADCDSQRNEIPHNKRQNNEAQTVTLRPAEESKGT